MLYGLSNDSMSYMGQMMGADSRNANINKSIYDNSLNSVTAVVQNLHSIQVRDAQAINTVKEAGAKIINHTNIIDVRA